MKDLRALLAANLHLQKLMHGDPTLFSVAVNFAAAIPLVPAAENDQRARISKLATDALKEEIDAGFNDETMLRENQYLKILHGSPEFEKQSDRLKKQRPTPGS